MGLQFVRSIDNEVMELASPQIEQGYIRIANDLWDEILRRSFSKRQQNLVLFIWRLSYGTGQKDCKVEQFNLFELSGIYKSDIKKELNYLRECEVLNWDEETMIFSINKNYKLWQISPNKNWDSDKFKSLIHDNLSRKKVSKTPTIKESKVSELPTIEKSGVSETQTIEGEEVSKTLTTELVKHQPTPSTKSIGNDDTGSLKTCLKTLSTKDIKDKKKNPYTFFEKNIAPLTPHVSDQITDWTNFFSDDVIIFSMELAVESNKRNINYCNTVLTNWKNEGIKNINDAKRSNQEFKNRFTGVKSNQSNEVVPEWFDKRNKPAENNTTKKVTPEEEKERAELAALIQGF